ncbi:MFS transporter [Cuniculiplasma divulgatum]|uniref:Phosphate:H+ symporter n=1 Tax=Cuniculiplasma divulgatum TaxID=1673428 RepID=A0A1N5SCA5_9ARCH|nr:MFS transporter [Cuniculiplasma divulgatum]SIM33634.1 phosphate:H+ symporter [Cuniculiplasma divulgatum]
MQSTSIGNGMENNILGGLDNSGLRRGHVKTMFVAGMGFFTDAYLLFVLTVASPILASTYGFNLVAIKGTTNLLGFQVLNIQIIEGLISSAVLFGAFFGAMVFGHIADRYGRKKIYGLELSIMIIFTILSALSVNYPMLIITRFIVGIGVGGDYPISSTIMSEYSSSKHRGKLVSMVFAMQGFGLVSGALVGLGSIYILPIADSWRLMLAFGAIPAIYVVYLRRKLMETPRFSLQVEGNKGAAEKAISTITGVGAGSVDQTITKVKKLSSKDYMHSLRKYLIFVLGTTISWFIFDMAFYGTTLNNGFILQQIGYGSSASLRTTIFNTAIGDTILAGAFALPGYWISVGLIDKAGRRLLQWLGFAVMAISYIVLGFEYSFLKTDIDLFIMVFGVSYLFGNIGPNTTTFILPTELFPTKIRSTAHGIAASIAKLGAGIFTFLFLILGTALGNGGEFELLGAMAAIGAVVTLLTIRETKGLSLEVSSEDPAEGVWDFKPNQPISVESATKGQ